MTDRTKKTGKAIATSIQDKFPFSNLGPYQTGMVPPEKGGEGSDRDENMPARRVSPSSNLGPSQTGMVPPEKGGEGSDCDGNMQAWRVSPSSNLGPSQTGMVPPEKGGEGSDLDGNIQARRVSPSSNLGPSKIGMVQPEKSGEGSDRDGNMQARRVSPSSNLGPSKTGMVPPEKNGEGSDRDENMQARRFSPSSNLGPSQTGTIPPKKGGEGSDRDGNMQVRNVSNDSEIEKFLFERSEAARRDIYVFDSIIASHQHEADLSSEILLAIEKDRNKHHKLQSDTREFLLLVKARIKRRWNYIKLFGILVSFSLYCSALLLQHSNSSAYDVESRSGYSFLSHVVSCVVTDDCQRDFEQRVGELARPRRNEFLQWRGSWFFRPAHNRW